jgi:DNA-directed RNA polymerase specialized sigma24 family protein
MDLISSGMIEMRTDPELLLILAKAGSGPALIRLLDRCRSPLVKQAQGHLGRRLRAKLDVEDLLQDVSLLAHRDIGSFRGRTECGFLCWLRNILARILMNQFLRGCVSPSRARPGTSAQVSRGAGCPTSGPEAWR